MLRSKINFKAISAVSVLSDIDRARARFSSMPAEVFDLWLLDAVRERGWQFSNDQNETVESSWAAFFLRLPLDYWSSCDWKQERSLFHDIFFEPGAVDKAHAIKKEATTGQRIFYPPIEKSAERYFSCLNFINQRRELPAPLIVVELADDLCHVVDGHHRLAALITRPSVLKLSEFVVDLWVGRSVLATASRRGSYGKGARVGSCNQSNL